MFGNIYWFGHFQPTCPGCNSKNCSKAFYPVNINPHYYSQFAHGGGLLRLIGVSIASHGYEAQQKEAFKKRLENKDWKCLDCGRSFFNAEAAKASITWKVSNKTSNDEIYLKFYSQDRELSWPNDDKVYFINKGQTRTYDLRIDLESAPLLRAIEPLKGEKICYGAWIPGDSSSYWGVGKDNKHGCENCCCTLNNETNEKATVLVD